MSQLLKHSVFPITVFITGACVLIVEIVAVRVLSPYFGNTIFTFSSVISVILAALSIGYYVGGKYADHNPSERRFFGIILVSSIVLLGFYFLGIVLLPALSLVLPLTSGPLISSFLLFFAPAFLLGTLSPFAVKLQTLRTPERGIGSVSGVIFFWSTLGSIFGSVSAGFVLIPHFGLDRIFVMVGIILFILGLVPLLSHGLERKKLIQSVSALVLSTSLIMFTSEQLYTSVLYSKDGVYEKITIYDDTIDGRPARFFQQDLSSSGAMFLDTDDPRDHVYEYSKYYSLYKVFTPDVRNVLVIGGGAYTIPKAFLHELPDATVHVSEIEPLLYELSKKYFNVTSDTRLRNYTEDGRRMLKDSDINYDVIFSDVYYSLFSIPSHFTTKEFFSLAKDKLNEDGIFIANLIGDLSRQQPSLLFSEIKTFQSVFPNSYFFAAESTTQTDTQNIVLVGYKSDRVIDFTTESLRTNSDPVIASLHEKLINLDQYDLSPYPILTDTFSPVEYLTSKVIERRAEQKSVLDGNEMLAVIDQQLRYGPRHMGAHGHDAVVKFLRAEMNELTGDVREQSFEHRGGDGNTYTLTNIIARLFPDNERRIILGTHFDSKRYADKDRLRRDMPVPGANDSASGVAVLIELARALASTSTPPNVGVDIVFFDGEEGDVHQGSDYSNWKPLGSTHFSEKVPELYGEQKPLSGVVLDMVCDKHLQIYQEQSSVENAPFVVNAFWDIARSLDSRVFRDEVKFEIMDDHTPLNAVGIPSILLIDFEYPPFHTTKDTLDKCSGESLEIVGRAVFKYVYSL